MKRTFASLALGGLAALTTACGTQQYASAHAPAKENGPAPLDAALVTPGFGWVLTPDRLMLTRDGGTTFTTAAVPVPSGWARAAFFSDATHGLVAGAGGHQIILARTSDGGATWTKSTVIDQTAFPALRYSAVRIAFGDADHGAIMARTGTGENFSVGTLFSTANAGASWSARKAPVAGDISVEPGGRIWLAGGVLSDQLYTTSDTGAHWTRSKVPQPADGTVTVSPPVDHTLPVTLTSGGATQVELFTTADNGRSWRQSGRVAVHGRTAAGVNVPVARTGDGPLVLDNAGGHAYRAARASAADVRPSGLPAGVFATHFSSDGRSGWALAANGHCAQEKHDCTLAHVLTATSDGGTTWKQLRRWTVTLK
jgi:hypothetical protein